jgi:FixJ family two-component response regulator
MAGTQQATVFVIDDDASARRSLRRLLSVSGYAVEEFASAVEFLERVKPTGTGCVILDIRMPHMTGPELFDRMARSGYSLPVIFLTGHGDVPTSVHAMKDGAVDFLLKPVDSELLLQAIEQAIGRHVAKRAQEIKSVALHTRLSALSRREREVMEHVVRGEPNKLIAARLGISEKTVKVHRHRVMEKTKAGSVAELVRLADAASPQGSEVQAAPGGRRG